MMWQVVYCKDVEAEVPRPGDEIASTPIVVVLEKYPPILVFTAFLT
jgi:hypothetical protein